MRTIARRATAASVWPAVSTPGKAVSDRWVRPGLLMVLSLGLGLIVLMIGGLPLKWGVVLLMGLLLAAVAVILPARQRFLEVALMLSFGATIDVHFGPDVDQVVDPSGVPISVTGLLVCALAAVWFARRMEQRPRSSLWGGMGMPMLGLWLASICSALVSQNPRLVLYSLINIGYFTLLTLYLANTVSTQDHLQRVLGWLMVAIVITSMVALIEHIYTFDRSGPLTILGLVSQEDVQTMESTKVLRSGGLLKGSNGLAWVLAEILPLMLAVSFYPASGYRRSWLLGGLGIGLLALISTYSRGGWAAFIVALTLVLILMATRRFGLPERGWIGKLLIIGLILALLAAPLYGNIYTRLTEDDRGSAQMRLPMMQVALRIIRDNPIFGVGLGNYQVVMRQYDQSPDWVHQDFPGPVHNIYLHITAEIGLFGGFCFLVICLLALWQGVQAMRAPDPFLRMVAIGLLAGFVAYLLVGMKELGSLGALRHRFFWLAVGLLMATRRTADKQRPTISVQPSV